MKYKVTRDKYLARRGSHFKIYQIKCSNCKSVITKYQKDGPGVIKRLYLDRMIDFHTKPRKSKLICEVCNSLIGTYYIYKPEKRPAYRLPIGTISKSLIE